MAVTGVWDATSKMIGVQNTYRTDTSTDVKKIFFCIRCESFQHLLHYWVVGGEMRIDKFQRHKETCRYVAGATKLKSCLAIYVIDIYLFI